MKGARIHNLDNGGAQREEERPSIQPSTPISCSIASFYSLAIMMFRTIALHKLKRKQWRPMKRHDYVIQEDRPSLVEAVAIRNAPSLCFG